MGSIWQRLTDQVRVNPRIRFALPVIAALLLLFAWQEADGIRTDLEADVLDEKSQLARIEALRGEDIWIERASESATTLQAMRARLPAARTSGLAQAALQNDLRDVIRALGDIRPPQIQVEQVQSDNLPDGVIQIRASMAAAIAPRRGVEVVQRLERGTALTRIESLEIRGGLNPGLQLVFSRYFQLTSTEDAP